MHKLDNAYSHAGDKFTEESIMKGIDNLRSEYKRILAFKDPIHYKILVDIDNDIYDGKDSEKVDFLLFNLLLFEYNDFFWKSHPVVRLLEGYINALNALKEN